MIAIADLVNQVIEKLTTAKVTFEEIASNHVIINWGHRRYLIQFAEYPRLSVSSLALSKHGTTQYHDVKDSYSRWVEDVLNGKTRNEKGEMA